MYVAYYIQNTIKQVLYEIWTEQVVLPGLQLPNLNIESSEECSGIKNIKPYLIFTTEPVQTGFSSHWRNNVIRFKPEHILLF